MTSTSTILEAGHQHSAHRTPTPAPPRPADRPFSTSHDRPLPTRPLPNRAGQRAAAPTITVPVPDWGEIRTAGVDLTDVSRLATVLHRYQDRLVRRLCGTAEQHALRGYRGELLSWGIALAFGLKEAVIKAAGGFPPGGRFTDINTSALVLAARPRLGPGHGTAGAAVPVTGMVSVSGASRNGLDAVDDCLVVVGGAHQMDDDLLVCWVLGLREVRS